MITLEDLQKQINLLNSEIRAREKRYECDGEKTSGLLSEINSFEEEKKIIMRLIEKYSPKN